jgi:hypothetical protein
MAMHLPDLLGGCQFYLASDMAKILSLIDRGTTLPVPRRKCLRPLVRSIP